MHDFQFFAKAQLEALLELEYQHEVHRAQVNERGGGCHFQVIAFLLIFRSFCSLILFACFIFFLAVRYVFFSFKCTFCFF
jgi:hypothetical protein